MTENQQWVRRRGQLFVELFLGDLKPALAVAAPDAADAHHDYLIGFKNARRGTNLCVVEYVATDRPVPARYPLPQADRNRWVNSNVPVLLLVVDVVRNQLYYAWPADPGVMTAGRAKRASLALAPVDDAAKRDLRRRLVKGDRKASVAAVA